MPHTTLGQADDAAPVFDWQGHRGARGLLPENTIPAFLKALDLGMTTLEMDAVISADSQVVVSHEPWFNHAICRQPSGEAIPEADERSYRIFALPYAEVARYDCGSLGNPRFPEQQKQWARKPLLREVITAAEAYAARHGLPPVQYNIETKSTPDGDDVMHPTPDVFTQLLYDVVVETGVKDRTILQSFDPRTLRVGRALDPDWRLALLIEPQGDAGLVANLENLGFTPHIYSPYYRLVDATMVTQAHDRGMQVIPWTVNTLEEMQALVALGVDGIITDYPDRAQPFLEGGE